MSKHFIISNRSIWPVNGTLTGTTPMGQNRNGWLHTSQALELEPHQYSVWSPGYEEKQSTDFGLKWTCHPLLQWRWVIVYIKKVTQHNHTLSGFFCEKCVFFLSAIRASLYVLSCPHITLGSVWNTFLLIFTPMSTLTQIRFVVLSSIPSVGQRDLFENYLY